MLAYFLVNTGRTQDSAVGSKADEVNGSGLRGRKSKAWALKRGNALRKILYQTWLGCFWGEIWKLMLGALYETLAVQIGMQVETQRLFQDRGKSRTNLIELAGRRTFRMQDCF
jgi:hypothetical protein